MRRLLSMMFLGAVLSGCFHTVGNESLSMALVQENVKTGITTKQGLLDSIGKPYLVSLVTGTNAVPASVPQTVPKERVKEIWQYFKMSQEGLTSVGMTTVSFFIDDDGVVLDYVMTEKQ